MNLKCYELRKGTICCLFIAFSFLDVTLWKIEFSSVLTFHFGATGQFTDTITRFCSLTQRFSGELPSSANMQQSCDNCNHTVKPLKPAYTKTYLDIEASYVWQFWAFSFCHYRLQYISWLRGTSSFLYDYYYWILWRIQNHPIIFPYF